MPFAICANFVYAVMGQKRDAFFRKMTKSGKKKKIRD